MASSTLFETYGVRERGTTARLEGSPGGSWKLSRARRSIRIDDGTHRKRTWTTTLEVVPVAAEPAPVLVARDRELASAFATGGIDAWLAASVPSGGAFHWISGLALGTDAVREGLDEAAKQFGTRTPRFARLAPSGKLGVTLGTAAPAGAPQDAFAYLTLWQLGADGTWRVLFSTLHMPQ